MLEATYMPIKDKELNVISILKIATDITKREETINKIKADILDVSDSVLQTTKRGHELGDKIKQLTSELINQSKNNSSILLNLNDSSKKIKLLLLRLMKLLIEQTY